ncbi:MAG: hypothetical protein IKC76_02760, partial [Firmicutes bacterium]|nr:hypothetical protein [Bacillota bacterium]
MKKLLILCLMLLLCCAFAACGGDSEQEAIDAVGGQSGPSVSTTGTPSIKNVPKDAYGQYEKAEVEAALPLFCGTWQGYFDEEGQIVTIDDDGSCTVQGEELSWELRSIDTEDGEAVLKLLRGKDGVYTLYVETEPLPYGENTYQFVHMRGD